MIETHLHVDLSFSCLDESVSLMIFADVDSNTLPPVASGDRK